MVPLEDQQATVLTSAVQGEIKTLFPEGIIRVGDDGANFVMADYGATAAVHNGTITHRLCQLTVNQRDAVNDPAHVGVWIADGPLKSNVRVFADVPPLTAGSFKCKKSILVQDGTNIWLHAILTHVTVEEVVELDEFGNPIPPQVINSVLDSKTVHAHGVFVGADPTP